ncbi:MAG: peptidylprolyl isomerase [Paludibacteraceae bacterium]|nr:peptidylprolyl isomerase [Paludibacteraceae bacterium]
MSKRIIFLGFVWFMVCSIFATDEVLMRIGDKKILQSEFEYFYKKNTIDTALNSSLEDYLQLFQNFKLKVCEAETLGIDTTSSFLEEFRVYRSQNASLYLTDKNKEELLMKEIYSHLLEDVDASHILIKVPFNASPEDTLLLYQKALNICKRLEKENFEEVAKEVSDDYSTKQKGGRLGFFTGMMTIFPFENAAYKTKIGEVSEPIRSSIGYHIIKVHDRRKAIGEIRVAHILKQIPQQITTKEQDSIQNLVQEIHKRLEKKEDFALLARSFSDDRKTYSNGGELMWFGLGKMTKEFEKAAFDLREVGEISKPIKTIYGWHIIQLKEKRDVFPYEKKKNDIARLIQYDGRKELIRQSFIKQLKKEYGFSVDSSSLRNVSIIFSNAENKSVFLEKIKNENQVVLATFANQTIFSGDFADFLVKEFTKAKSEDFNVVFDYFAGEKVFAFEDSQLENKYPDFKNLMQEYHDGLLLFEISRQKVWEEATKDTVKLREFFEQNKEKFAWEKPRYKGFLLECRNKKIAKQAKQIIKNANPDSIINYIENRINIDSVANIKIQKGFWTKGDNEIIDKTIFKVKTSNKRNSNLPIIVTVGEKIKIPENYNDALGKVITLYQSQLEKEWISDLRKKYPIWVNKNLLKNYCK